MGTSKIINDKTSIIRKRPTRPPPPANPPPVAKEVEPYHVTNLDYSDWDTSSVKDVSSMFKSAPSANPETEEGTVEYDPITQQFNIIDHNGDKCILAADCFGFDHGGGGGGGPTYNTVMELHKFIQNLKDNEEENEKVAKMSVEGAGKLRTGIIKDKPIRPKVEKDQPERDWRDDLGPEDRAKLDTSTHNCELEEKLTCMKLHELMQIGGDSGHTVTKVIGGFIYYKTVRSSNGNSVCSTFVPCEQWYKDGSIDAY